MSEIIIREATRADAGLILKFIIELAIYEKAEEEVVASVADIERTLFDPTTTTEAVICMNGATPIGFAVYFLNYSTWLGKNGLYLEDLYVSPASRGIGAGKKLLRHLAKIAVAGDCGRFQWQVLTWNEPAIEFYKSLGAKSQDEWIGYRLDGEALMTLARGDG